MSNILDEILATKRAEVAAAKSRVSISSLQAQIAAMQPTRDFIGAIRAKHAAGMPAVIAEIKKKSPSAGMFRVGGDFDPAQFAARYAENGAACLSVLTDHDYFGGTADDLRAARAACSLPIIRKDFIVDPYQLYEARAMGADAVLFIVDAVPIADFRVWETICAQLGLAVLAESHNAAQLEDALTLKTPLVGINNRDLTRFVTDLNVTFDLLPRIAAADSKIVVTESGIENRSAIEKMRASNVMTFLVGGALMKSADPGAALQKLFAR